MRQKLYLETFGCQMNVLDSELVMGELRACGYESVDDLSQAHVIIYNTCSVREHAEQKVWSRLGELRQRKADDPGVIIGVIGCLAERDGANLFRRYPHIDILCGPSELDKLPGMVRNAAVTMGRQSALMGRSGGRRTATLAAAEDTLEMLDLSRSISASDERAQAYVRITRGCNKFCTYCVVPFTRGAEVHRPPQNVIDEVRKLADAGVVEVTLLGQTINHYAFEHGDGRVTTFAELIYQIHEAVPHLPRLRFVTSFPRDFTDEALAAMRDCSRICRYLHAPAQHGSDRILKLMNRGYTSGAYLEFIERARQHMPDISIASDFIVGFPSETDEEYDQTADLLRRCRFKNSFIFKYSPRPGTAAVDRFADDIPDEVKRKRNNDLLGVQQEICDQENRKMIGKTVEVLVEGHSKLVTRKSAGGSVELGWEKKAGDVSQLVGRTRGDQVVVFDGPVSLKGRLLDVEIVDARSLTLLAGGMAEIELADAVRQARAKPQVLAAVGELYKLLEGEIAVRRPLCVISGRCCRFDEYGHRLYITTMELAAFFDEYEKTPLAPGKNPGGCPIQVNKLCGVHRYRPMGCRLFFCDETSVEWQRTQYEVFHARLKRLHESLDVPYFYMEWRTALAALGLT